MKLLLACNKKTLMVHNMSLYEYFYKQNQQPSAQHVYIGKANKAQQAKPAPGSDPKTWCVVCCGGQVCMNCVS